MIPTYIINLDKRTDRRANILKEFSGKDEFNVMFIAPIKNSVSTVSLWLTIQHIISSVEMEEQYIIICEDDHQFTAAYSKEFLLYNIAEAQDRNADILSGGISGYTNALQIDDTLFWMQKFSGLQFTVIFKSFFQEILSADFNTNNTADHKISDLSENKLLIYPFISTQKEFGYSDITLSNNQQGRVDLLFTDTSLHLNTLKEVAMFYKLMNDKPDDDDYNNITIPTYVINLPERNERKAYIKKQFEGKDEFEVTITEAIKNTNGALGLWLSIRKIIQIAIANDDDVIIICEDDHQFTPQYSKDYLIKNIIDAHYHGADMLSGGIGHFAQAMPISQNRFWIDIFYSTQFLVLYRKVFQKILDNPFDGQVTADDFLSNIASNKMVLFPFISTQIEFGYSDVTNRNNEPGFVESLFANTINRLEILKRIYNKYSGINTELSETPLLAIIKSVNNITPRFYKTVTTLP
jgi:hypothetical protein